MTDNPNRSPEVEAALGQLKKNPQWEMLSGGTSGGLLAGLVAWTSNAKNSLTAFVAAAGAVAFGALSFLGSKHYNKRMDEIANNPNAAAREAELKKQRYPVGVTTPLAAISGGIVGAMAVSGAPAHLIAAGKNIGRTGKLAIIGSGVALGAIIASGISHHLTTSWNRKLDNLSDALKKQPAGAVERLELSREAAAQAGRG